MSKKAWIWAVIVGIILVGGSFWGGMTYAQSKATTSRFAGTGAAAFAGRTGAAGFGGGAALAGGGTTGTVIQVGNGSFTVQLPSSTSTTAATGTKLVLVSNSTELDELETVPLSNLQVGQTVTVSGATNSDGSITATSVMIRPATTRAGSATTQSSSQ